MRTVIVSDLHGHSSSLRGALEDSSFADGDRLVIAGDLVDGGPEDTIALADSLGATVLAGNHEVSAALGIPISPQDDSTLQRAGELRERLRSGEWPLAVSVDGWLVTHAGVSTALSDLIDRAGSDPASLARLLNELFLEELDDAMRSRSLTWTGLDRYRLLGGFMGPLWFRPHDMRSIPGGLRQVVGHTAPEFLGERLSHDLEAAGWLLIEPGGHRGNRPEFRYALIEQGRARVRLVNSDRSGHNG